MMIVPAGEGSMRVTELGRTSFERGSVLSTEICTDTVESSSL